MKKFSKEDLIEKFNEMKDDVVKAKEFAEDLIYVTKGYVTEGLKREKEQYYIDKKDLKEEMKENAKYQNAINQLEVFVVNQKEINIKIINFESL